MRLTTLGGRTTPTGHGTVYRAGTGLGRVRRIELQDGGSLRGSSLIANGVVRRAASKMRGFFPFGKLRGQNDNSILVNSSCENATAAKQFALQNSARRRGRGRPLGCLARLLRHQIDRHNGAGGGGQIGRQGR